MSASAQLPRQQPAPTIPSSVTAPAILSLTSIDGSVSAGHIPSYPSSSSSTSSPRIPSLSKNTKSNNPLIIPEILELVLVHVLAQFQTSSHAQNPFAFSTSPSSLATTNDIQLQIRAQKPISTRLAFLRVNRLWYEVGEPLIWRNIKWADYQHEIVHQRIWRHWNRVRSLEFEYGKKTTDTEVPLVTPTASPSITENLSTTTPYSSSTTAAASTSSNWTNGTRARMRNLLGGDSSVVVAGQQTQTNSTITPAASNIGNPTSNTRAGDPAALMAGRPRITLGEALHDLARTLSRPSNLPHYRPTPLPLTDVHFHKRIVHKPDPSPYPKLVPLLHRSQLTSLTLTGLFRLETFLHAILPFVPELTYLDICLRCYEWRDEIRLDKVLRSCPKLQHLSVDRNMIGRVHFDDPSTSDNQEGFDLEDYYEDDQRSEDGNQDKFYSGTPWHLKYAHSSYLDNGGGNGPHWTPSLSSSAPSTTDATPYGNPSGGNVFGLPTGQKGQHQKRQSQRQRPLALRVLKLKKVRMAEEDFMKLLRLCPLLEEMDVFSTIYWSWSRRFLKAVSGSCPKIKHLHLTTNYAVGGGDASDSLPTGGSMQAGIVIFHETPQEHLSPQNNAAAVNPGQEQPNLQPPYDPVGELIKMYPGLYSYDARYVRFQDRALETLQHNCRHLESLDLTSCREVSSKAIHWFLRNMPTLKHFSGSRIVLRIEDLIESAEEHDRIVAKNDEIKRRANNVENGYLMTELPPNSGIRDPGPKWWVCGGLETFIIGIKNPIPPGTERDFDLQGERTADFQYYYRDYQGSGSSSGAKDNSQQGGNGGRPRFVPGYNQYDHTQYCTFVLFQQLGRLRRLKRLELHGGRFDLGINSESTYPSPPTSLTRSHYSDSAIQDKDQANICSSPSDKEKDNQAGSIARRGLSRMKSFLSLGGAVGKGKQRLDYDSAVLDPKSKGKNKASNKDKGKSKDKGKLVNSNGSSDALIQEPNLSNSSLTDEMYPSTGGQLDSSLGSIPNQSHTSYRIVPSHLSGFQPLAGLSNLQSFSMVWSNFPKLREQEIAWICQNWTSLEWISLGLVPECEWAQIRYWVRSRRSDVVVVFEK
ncbi:hypothetical protein BGX27_011097 [Mortierella sp. AM989]|nr:hypothetical protein BGX27_011097 [Mortierella sp. AM989]